MALAFKMPVSLLCDKVSATLVKKNEGVDVDIDRQLIKAATPTSKAKSKKDFATGDVPTLADRLSGPCRRLFGRWTSKSRLCLRFVNIHQ
jgi:hypothetical protein